MSWQCGTCLKSLASLLEPCIAWFPKSCSSQKRLDRDEAKSGSSHGCRSREVGLNTGL